MKSILCWLALIHIGSFSLAKRLAVLDRRINETGRGAISSIVVTLSYFGVSKINMTWPALLAACGVSGGQYLAVIREAVIRK